MHYAYHTQLGLLVGFGKVSSGLMSSVALYLPLRTKIGIILSLNSARVVGRTYGHVPINYGVVKVQ